MSTQPYRDQYGIIASGLPPELDAEMRGLTRRQALAEAMMKQSMESPQGQMAGRFYVPPSPLQGVAKMVQSYMANKRLTEGDRQIGDIGQRYQSGVADAITNYQRTKAGDPGRAPVLDPQEMEQQADLGTPAPPNVGAISGDPRRAVMEAMMNPYLRGNPFITAEAKTLQPTTLGRSMVIPATGEVVATDSTWQAEQQATREAREAQAREARDQRQRELEMRLEDAKLGREERAALARELQEMRSQSARELRTLAAGMRQPPSPVPVTLQDPNNPNATIVIDARTRQPLGAGPKMTETGKMEAKRQFNMQGIGQTISEAEALLTNKAKPPTGSGVGAVVDFAAGLVGATPSGAAEAQRLKAVGGALLSKMPRMEGPQSDKDVAVYREMAGMVGDATIPVDRRVAALEEVKKLWAKYERLNPDAFAPSGDEPPPGAVRRK
jgi:hypothetical protein